MRITIIALGSRGDVQPYIPLGIGLQSAGHRVRIATFREFAPLILTAGLDLHPLQGDARELLNAAVDAGLLSGRSNPLRFMQGVRKSYASLADTLAGDLSDPVLRDSELILNQLPAYLFGGDLAEYLSVPWAIVSVIPLTRSRYRPMIGFPSAPSFIPGYNALTYRLGEQMAWGIFRQAVNRWRRDVLDLPVKPYLGDFGSIFQQKVPVLNGFSSHVVPRPPDWGDQVHVTGWWQPTDPAWEPPERLRQFIDTGERPIFIGFGSIPVRDPERITSIIVEAVRIVGRKAILHAGWAGLGKTLPDEILPIKYAPYEWLFPRMAAIVHHGGSGTSGFAFKSGVPSLTVPFGFDQYYWGARGYDLGVSPPYLPFKNLESDLLAEQIQAAISDSKMAARSEDLGRLLEGEDGVANAVEMIQRITRSHSG